MSRRPHTIAVAFAAILPSPALADIVVGAGAGGPPTVARFSASGTLLNAFSAYNPAFSGGVRVAVGDVDNDGAYDIITGPGPGGNGAVLTYNQSGGQIGALLPYPSFTGGIYVASGRTDGPASASSIIAGMDAAPTPMARVFAPSGVYTYPAPGFGGGVRVASGDVDGDGFADLIAGAGPGGGPQVQVYSGASGSLLSSFFAFAPTFAGGVHVASGDINGDGFADIVVGADAGAAPQVNAFSGADGALLMSFLAFTPSFQGGVRIAVGDVNGDGLAEIITGAGPGAGPHVKVFSGQTGAELSSFFAFDPSFTGGVYVAVPAPGAAATLLCTSLLAFRRRR